MVQKSFFKSFMDALDPYSEVNIDSAGLVGMGAYLALVAVTIGGGVLFHDLYGVVLSLF